MSVIDNVKDVAKLIHQIDNIELYRKILDLQSEIMQVVEENHDLQLVIKDFQEKAEIKQTMVFSKNVYIKKNEKGNEEGPYCSACWDDKQKLVRLQDYGHGEYLQCPICKTHIMTAMRPFQLALYLF